MVSLNIAYRHVYLAYKLLYTLNSLYMYRYNVIIKSNI